MTQPEIAPVPLPSNPVWRSYAGGRVLRDFRGEIGSRDDHFPEDWLASLVSARNGANSQRPDEGLSRLGGAFEGIALAEALQQDPRFWLGPRTAPDPRARVLWKLLDSSVRLQFQAHPDASFARKHLNSNAGKTECWYILATRDSDAGVYLGFQRSPGREEWARMFREQAVEEMLGCFDRIAVKPGECYVVPAGTPHAIGAGVFMVELMEPTDWVVRCERVNAGITLPWEACLMGLDFDRCLEVFDYRSHSLESVNSEFRQEPTVLRRSEDFTEEEVVGPKWHGFFRLHRLRGSGKAAWAGEELMLFIAAEGEGELKAGREVFRVSRGQTWLLPGAAARWEWAPESGHWEILLAKLPVAG